MQTARILADRLKPQRGFTEIDGLAPLDDPEVWASRLGSIAEDTMLVGHLPHLAKLACNLLCGNSEKMCIDFKMGGIVCF
jgi:phosphohistidine phosphatase